MSDFKRIEKAIHYLIENAEEQPSLEALSRFLGLSEFHCHRLFKKWASITPKDFLQWITLVKAKSLLKNSQSTLSTTMDVGLSGPSRLHDLFVTHEAMTPGEYKTGGKGIEISWGKFDSPIGKATIGVTARGICFLSFTENEKETLKLLQKNWPHAEIKKKPKAIAPYAQSVVSKMLGKQGGKTKIFLKGTPFQIKVWEALLKIPEGQVATYQELARIIGSPKAVRAVGTAVGANPIGYLIPCHRVIRSTGFVGEYHWGSERKTALLGIEHAHHKCIK